MVQNLLKNGHQVKIFDIAPVAIERCRNFGAIAATSPQDAIIGLYLTPHIILESKFSYFFSKLP